MADHRTWQDEMPSLREGREALDNVRQVILMALLVAIPPLSVEKVKGSDNKSFLLYFVLLAISKVVDCSYNKGSL